MDTRYIKYLGFENEIYKNMGDYFLKVTPWVPGEERRKHWSEFHGSKPYVIPAILAGQLINNIFDKYEDSWMFENNIYKTKKNDNLSNPDKVLKEHEFGSWIYYLVYRHGHLYWARYFGSVDRYMIYEFKDIYTAPIKCLAWVSARSLKPVYKVNSILKYNRLELV